MKKEIIVTGTSKGLGLILTRKLLKDGYFVHSISRSISDQLNELANLHSDQIRILQFDMTKTDEIVSFCKETFPLQTPIFGFVNNAAVAYDDIITNINMKSLENMFRVNTFSPMLMVKYIIRNMLFNKTQGSIVHISSISAHTGYKGLAMYASSKGALEAFSKNTAREWGEKKIRSNCIIAGFMETDMSQSLNEDQKKRIYLRTSLKEAVSKESVADSVIFLLGDKSISITGQNIFVDNGTI